MRGDWEGVDFSFKDEFGATLSGMMGALAEIQKKGDSMLAGIRRQREVGVLMLMTVTIVAA